MREFLNDIMEKIFVEFKQELEELESCCCLKRLRFNQGMIPDYSQKIIQQLYLLRYFPAYFIEYYDIYNDLIEMNFLDEFNVLSVGCGCVVDYYGLYYALNNDVDRICYTGIDKIDWAYKDRLNNDNYYFIQQDISEWEILDWDQYNLIIFPKSIGEFECNTFRNFKNALKNTDFLQDKICLISSLRDAYSDIDSNRMEELIQIFESVHNYQCLDDKTSYTHYKENVGLKKYFDEFDYPDYIMDFVRTLIEQCQEYVNNDYLACTSECEQQLNKSPILKTGHIKYQIKRLERL